MVSIKFGHSEISVCRWEDCRFHLNVECRSLIASGCSCAAAVVAAAPMFPSTVAVYRDLFRFG